jgi:hypothetical protein
MEVRSSKAGNPPYQPPLPYTPLVCEYSPVSVDTRLGQHSEFGTNALRNVTPRSRTIARTFGMTWSESARWPSV